MTKKTRPTQAKKPQVTGNSGQLTLAQARQLTQKKPEQPKGWKALGVQLMKVDRYEEASEALARALELSPNDPEAVARLGYVEHKLNKPEQALASLNRALELAPDSLLANIGFAKLYKDHGHYQKALAHIEAAERLSPKDIVVMDAKGSILHALYRFEEAMAIFDRLTQADPKNFVHWNNAGNVRRDLGLLKEATDCYRKADKLAGSNFAPYSNYLTSLHYLPEFSREAIFKVCQEWEVRFAPAKVPQRPRPSNSTLNKRIRIGMFSDGFRQHPVGKMTISALESVDRSAFELFAYSTSGVEDPITRRFKKRVDHWALIQHLNDEGFAQRVRDDEIDILLDLSGHNSGNRMRTMAMQPAPLLVKWVGGLINTTGVTAIDYLISDSIETPAGEDAYYTEKLIRLPDDYICFEPPENAPQAQVLPALSNGYITLGCFNNPTKLNEVVLKEWAELMHQLPDSRLFLKGRPYSSQAYCERLQSFMAEQGISAERLIIEGPAKNHELLEAYNRVDIALDPWPYSGGLTTCEAFIMGVPVVTMPGPTFAGRHSATHLFNAGMPELVTHSWEEYRQRVIGLAADLDSLSTIRSHLREILLQSPVCDGPRFAKHFTTAMRAIWQRYCEGKEPAALTLNKEGKTQFEGEAQPIELVHPEPLEDESDFKWEFTGKITTLDNGALLTSNLGATKLLELGAFTMISFDPASKVTQPEKLQAAGEFHHYPNVVLGDGNPATLYACLDPAMSATLRPLESVKTLTGEEPGPRVLTQLPVNSIPLDKINGLEAIDWLLLDNMNDSLAVLENGEKALKNTLLIQARVNFQPTHENQPELTLISHWAARHGFSFYRLNNETHISHLPKRDDLIERQATQLASADAIYIPNAERMAALDNNQRMKLAFVLHTVYGVKDLAYQILAKVEEKAEAYWKAEQSQPLPQPVATLPRTASAQSAANITTQSTKPFEHDWNLTDKIRVVDIGANPIDGTPPYAALLKQGHITLVGFEPQRQALAKLQTMKGRNETYLPHAVGDGKEAKLYLCQAPGMTSTLKPNNAVLDQFQGYPTWGKVKQVEHIKTVRLDDVKEIKGIDWLKIDIQGGELTVFRNGENQLKDTLVIQTEVNFIQLYENQPLFAEVDQWMRAHGLMLHTLLEERKRLYAPMVLNGQIHQGLNQLTTADAVYIKDITKLEEMSHLQINKMAFILSEAYGSHDLALRLIKQANLKEAEVKDISIKKISKESKSGVFVHVLFNTVHTQPLLEILQDETAAAGFAHHILIEKGRAIPGYDVDISKNPNAFYFSKLTQLHDVLDQCLKEDVVGVFFHGLFFDWQRSLVEAIGKRKKTVWVMWGGDLYNPINSGNLIDKTVGYLYGVSTWWEGDYSIFKEHYGYKKRIPFRYFGSKDYLKITPPRSKEKLIFAGNSGDPSNNHADILLALSKKKDIDMYSIVFPFSYNAPAGYMNKIKKYAERLNLKNVKFIESMLPAAEYFKWLSKAEITIMAHNRQQGGANINASIYYGNKVIVRKTIKDLQGNKRTNPLWTEVTHKFKAEPLDFDVFSDFTTLSELANTEVDKQKIIMANMEATINKTVIIKEIFSGLTKIASEE